MLDDKVLTEIKHVALNETGLRSLTVEFKNQDPTFLLYECHHKEPIESPEFGSQTTFYENDLPVYYKTVTRIKIKG